MEKKKAIIAISGGIDSVVAAAKMKDENYELYFLTVNYAQKNFKMELKNTKYFADLYNVKEHKIINMDWLGKLGCSLITDKNINIKSQNDNLIYVPYRNTCIISACVAWAELINADLIVTGSDLGPWVGPDNSPEYYKKFNELLKISTKINKKLKIVAPLNYNDKKDNIKLGLSLNVPFEHTWTCITRNDKACGECLPCKERKAGFNMCGINDPIKYLKK